jgi:DNA modification methylase
MSDIIGERFQLLVGDSRARLQELDAGSVQTVVTSPPYFGLRNYGHDAQIGLEESVEEYVEELVRVFSEVHRTLVDDGTLWLNLGDSYNGSGGAGGDYGPGGIREGQPKYPGRRISTLKPKDLIGIPWRVAFALQAEGWFLRQDIIWHKPHPMPESATDRCTRAHEYLFLLSKAGRYYYDHEALREPSTSTDGKTWSERKAMGFTSKGKNPTKDAIEAGLSIPSFAPNIAGRNRRSVWTIPTKPYRGAHFATMPVELAELCIRAGSRSGDLVLDPFAGSGTTGVAALRLDRLFAGVELNPHYADLAETRLRQAHHQLDLFGT